MSAVLDCLTYTKTLGKNATLGYEDPILFNYDYVIDENIFNRDYLIGEITMFEERLEGPQAPQGPEGKEGSKGEAGPRGSIGPQGPKGERGNQGIQGPLGAIGKLSIIENLLVTDISNRIIYREAIKFSHNKVNFIMDSMGMGEKSAIRMLEITAYTVPD